MKKIFIVLMASLTLFTLSACSDETAKTPTESSSEENVDVLIDPSYDERFDHTVEEAAACYFSLLTDYGLGNYILGFPEEYREGWRNDIELTEEEFEEALDNDTYSLHVTRDTDYDGATYCIEYEHQSEEEITGEEKEKLIKELSDYCYMTASTIERVVDHTYLVREYGIYEDTQEIIMDNETEQTVTMLYITGEGWYISPTEYHSY